MKTNTVKFITILSVATSLLWMFGLFWTMNEQFFGVPSNLSLQEESGTTVVKKEEIINIVALGDSLTRGTGDSSGKGYIGYLVEDLKDKTEQKIQLSNLAIKGQTTTDLKSQMIETEVRRQIRNADIIFMTIGGNDLFQSGQALFTLSNEEIQESKKVYLDNLDNIYKTIRDLNADAVLYHIGLYNPFSNLSGEKDTTSIVLDWNMDSVNKSLHYNNIVYIPTFDLFQLNVDQYLFNDKFHPNEQGYRSIAKRVANLVSEEGETNE